MRKGLFAFLLLFSACPLPAQTAPEGIWQGYDGEWRHVSSQLLALAEATPEEKFAWRPATPSHNGPVILPQPNGLGPHAGMTTPPLHIWTVIPQI
jgi:hypothetical protein